MRAIWFVPLLALAGCTDTETRNTSELAPLQGSWRVEQISPYVRSPSELCLFTLREDSTLALSLIFETAPRSRVWTPDLDVTYRTGKILWDDHEASLSESRDTMTVLRSSRGEATAWRYVRQRSADSLMAALQSSGGDAPPYTVPIICDDGWLCADMAAAGVGKAGITRLIERIRNGKHGDIHSFLLAKDSLLVVEEYFADNGRKYGPFVTRLFRERPHHLASTTKAFTSTLVGIAIDRGFIKDTEEPIYTYLPAYASSFSEEKKRIRISHMLTMTPGFEWRQFGVSDDRNDGMAMWGTDDVIRYVLQKPLETRPGEVFNYTNGVPTVMGAVIKNATGVDVTAFAEESLFRPLGISRFVWTSYPDGSLETDGGLALRSRDLAKLGQLFLNRGVWHGQRIVSEEWIHESTRERLRFGKSLRWGYGLYWMQADTKVNGKMVHSFFAPGDGNQILAVFPDLHVVVVFTAGTYGKDPKPSYYELFEEFILPAVMPRS
jgi:CubicO group peptidase (beta-lactamase class C family)